MTERTKEQPERRDAVDQFGGSTAPSLDGVGAVPVGLSRAIWVASLGLPIVLLAALTMLPDVPIGELLRDPLAVAEAPYYYGMISNLGVVVWSGCAAICLFAGLVLVHRHGWTDEVAFLFVAGGLTTAVMVDDLFLLHEIFYPYYLGLPEKLAFVVYAAIGLFYIVRFFKFWSTLAPLTFVSALVLLATSVITDTFFDPNASVAARLAEDGCKFLGICQWGAFHLRASLELVGRAMRG